MKTCVFAGTFDPFTKGHEYIVNKCLDLFDKVYIALGENDGKTPFFSLDERIEAIKILYKNNDKISVHSFSGMLVDFMKENNILVTVRGIRNLDDYKYETTMANYNFDMYPEITTLYIPTPNVLEHISSSAMRSIIGLKGDIKQYIPEEEYEYLEKIIKEKQKKK